MTSILSFEDACRLLEAKGLETLIPEIIEFGGIDGVILRRSKNSFSDVIPGLGKIPAILVLSE